MYTYKEAALQLASKYIFESSLAYMKRSCPSSSAEEPAKQRKMKHEMYKKWMIHYDCEYQTLTWLECEMRVEAM